MNKYIKIALIIVVLVAFTGLDAQAQCAMCRRIVESNLNDSAGTVAKNLNSAILYLMAIPYLVMASLLYIFYKNIQAKRLAEKQAQA